VPREVILVNQEDKKIGKEEKIKAHKKGKLHRAFSIFIFNKKGEILLQKRSQRKYHSGGLWSNACCSHPRPGKKILAEAKRRLKEEMGIETKLKKIFKIHYRIDVGNLVENEIDHVFVGYFEGDPKINKNEVESFRWENLKKVREDLNKNPENYTAWFKIILPKLVKKVKIKGTK
jgi:isopentenyl-diphosphate delta-isomerase